MDNSLLDTLLLPDKNSLTVMTQNLRCNDDNADNDGISTNVIDRAPRFAALVRRYNPDIIGTQETTAPWNMYIDEYLGAAYARLGCSRDGKDADKGEWNSLLYRRDRFDVITSDTFWLTDTPDIPSTFRESRYPRICTWAHLADKISGKEMLFCNTHLAHEGNEVPRLRQVPVILSFIESYRNSHPNLAFFLTGDFNTTARHASYKLFKDFGLADARNQTPDASDADYTFHAYEVRVGVGYHETIDHIFYDAAFAAPTVYRIASEKPGGFVSDHFAVVSRFLYK